MPSQQLTHPVPRLPGDQGVWIFVFADMMAFGLFFTLFTIGRASHPDLYESSRLALNPMFGLFNTLVLLTSSWFVVLAVHAASHGLQQMVVRYLLLAIGVGSCFAVSKIYEYTEKLQAGISMLTNEFFMYYFIFTGIHFLHFILGMLVLLVCLRKSQTQPTDHVFLRWIESCATYWHMVDLLWIVLFPLLYLVR